MEQLYPDIDRWPEDPRTMLADSLRDFALEAVRQQERIDSINEEDRPQPGSLYKLDGGFLKVHLQPPAADLVFSGQREGQSMPPDPLPAVWLLIPMGTEYDPGDELEDAVLEAEEMIVHVVQEGAEPEQFLSRDNYLGPAMPPLNSVADLAYFAPPSLDVQVEAAKDWVTKLQKYDLRTIVGSNRSEPDVA